MFIAFPHLYVDLIKHLYSDGHITAEEASQLSAKKLFEEPAAPTGAAPTINLSSATPSTGASTTTGAAKYDSFSSTFGLLPGINLKSPSTTGAVANSTISISTNQQSTGLVTMSQLSPAQLGTTVAGSQPSITVTPNTPVALSIATFPSSVSVKNVPAAPGAAVSHAAMGEVKTAKQRSGLVTTSEGAQPESLAVGDNVSQATSSAVSDASSNEDHSYYDDLVYDENDDTTSGMAYRTV